MMSHWLWLLDLTVTLMLTSGIPMAIPARAAAPADLDPGASQTGPADCSRILWVGGYRQQDPGSCPQTGDRRRRGKGYTDKPKVEERRRDQDRFAQERKAKREAEKKKAEDDRKFREAVKKAQDDARKEHEDHNKKCRGLGLPANCDLANPGKGRTPKAL